MATLSLAGAFGSAGAQGVGTVTGHVSGPGGEALAGAAVTVSGRRTAVSRADGGFRLALPPGTYELRARLLGYGVAAESVTVVAGERVERDFVLPRLATSLEAVAIIGSRGEQRTVISAPAPVDVLSAAELQRSGRTETAQLLQTVAPSFNLPRTTIGDGTDHIRPASLRGLSPDQVLVLVNGKRRHTSALVNLNGFVGRGSQAVDLNAIPASMIDHIEILRDGAAAQYGSDAIAGVINVVLKSNAPGMLAFEAGENSTTYNRDAAAGVAFPGQTAPITAHDGDVVASSLSYGWTLGSTGHLQVGGELRDRAGTNRTLADTRRQYFGGDPRNAEPPAIDHWQGDSYNHDAQLFIDAAVPLARSAELYAFGGLSKRRGASAGFWRRALDDRTVRAIYPDGFLPFIKSDIHDGSLAAGVRGEALGWKWDLGSVYGRNTFRFGVENSANASLGPDSRTSFYAGALHFDQSTTSLDLFREVRALGGRPLRVAVGGEFRADHYAVLAGEPDSYRDGGVPVLDSLGQATTRRAPVGSQVFPGFRPGDAGGHARTNGAVYADIETDLTARLLLGVAGRAERYSDFGGTTTGKVAARYQASRALAVRGAVSTGFRAPSLGQEFFSSTATNFINGAPFDIRTFPVATAEARLLGAKDLEPERSVNFSGGFAVEPFRGAAFTADYYRIDITDRIVLTDNFTGAAIQALFANAGLTGVNGGRFFSNAIDTRSHGVDLVASYEAALGAHGILRLSSGYNHNTVRVIHVDATPDSLSAFQEQLFGRVERARIERGNPRDNLYVAAGYTRGPIGVDARTQRYGEVSVAGGSAGNATGTLDQTYGAKWITDLSASVTVRSRYTLTLGADNLFDVYPDRNLNPGDPTTGNGGISNFGIFPYNAISPFGFNGRFVYTRLAVRL